MVAATRRTRDAAASTARLIAAAGEEFAARGFDGARVDRIAEASATNRAIMFQRFGDKAGLYRAVLAAVAADADAVRRDLVARRSGPPADPAQFRSLVSDLARANLRFLKTHPTAERILRWERASDWQVYRTTMSAPEQADPARADAARRAAVQRPDAVQADTAQPGRVRETVRAGLVRADTERTSTERAGAEPDTENLADSVRTDAARDPATDAAQVITSWFREGDRRGWLRNGVSAATQLTLTFELASTLVHLDEDFGVAVVTAALVVETAS
ncbi:helix-turn-helix transcriptional regulator [Planctomonas sp. JC2975]|uniref:TetR/AcrR family transcriptional regulator n=1 Tax=Planctomonas sp. JC2975 TaxID=2729626 RepID=UPI0014739BEB|nr:helix-turn-helix domain-containing protein [Planctomonas sp. JC2975]NNC12163.1 helix-turn-helix transcriptional regulator [Planctomonas sp. JC2975]